MSRDARSMFRSRCFSMRLMACANFLSERSLAVTYLSIARSGSVPTWSEGTCMAGKSVSGSNGRMRPRVDTRSRIIYRWVGLVACELFQYERKKRIRTEVFTQLRAYMFASPAIDIRDALAWSLERPPIPGPTASNDSCDKFSPCGVT